jgi:hypothetical protein
VQASRDQIAATRFIVATVRSVNGIKRRLSMATNVACVVRMEVLQDVRAALATIMSLRTEIFLQITNQ